MEKKPVVEKKKLKRKSQPIYSDKNWTYDVLNHTKQTDAVFIIAFMQKFIDYAYEFTFDASPAKLIQTRKNIYDHLQIYSS